MTALSVYGINTAATTLTTAEQLVTTSGGATLAGTGTKVGTSTGYGEVFSQGTLNAWAGAGSIGSPSGNGWLLDATILEGQTIASGTWTITLHLFNNGTTPISADIFCRIQKRSSSGVYTLIGTPSLTGQSIPTSTTLFTLTGSLSAMPFTTGDKLYRELWLNVGAGSSGINVKFNEARGSGAVGASGFAELDTPGFSATLLSAPPMHAAETVVGVLASKSIVANTLSAAEVAINGLNAIRS